MALTLIAIVVLLVAGLEWNRRRQPFPDHPRAGRTGVQDRDLERLLDELRAVRDWDTQRGTSPCPRLVNKGHAAD